jgi:hypothetical protein
MRAAGLRNPKAIRVMTLILGVHRFDQAVAEAMVEAGVDAGKVVADPFG